MDKMATLLLLYPQQRTSPRSARGTTLCASGLSDRSAFDFGNCPRFQIELGAENPDDIANQERRAVAATSPLEIYVRRWLR
jgi:hypothetical protein